MAVLCATAASGIRGEARSVCKVISYGMVLPWVL